MFAVRNQRIKTFVCFELKFVQVCALFTWDWKTTVPFYNALKMQSILSDEIQCFKALITIHKVMRDGHASVSRKKIMLV